LTNANKHKFLVCSKAKQRVVVVGSQWRGPETALSIKKVELRRSGDARRDMVTKPEKIHAMWVILYLSFISLYSFPLNTESLT